MITKEQQKQGAELMKTLVEKAWESATFKEQLIKNPIATVETLTGNKMQANIKVIVEDQAHPDYIYLNIPAKPKLDEFELLDEQLEMISGGEFIVAGVVIGVVAGAALLGGGMYVGYHYL